jgi:hypothetical protein
MPGKRLGAKAMRGREGRTRECPIRATIECTTDHAGVESLRMVVDDVLTKNERYRLGQITVNGRKVARMLLSDKANDFRDAVAKAVAAAALSPIERSAWRLEVLAVWPTQRHLDVSFANGDADAAVSATQDALQHAGALDNDVRIITGHGHSICRPGQRATVAHLRRITFAEQEAAITHLLPLVPQSPEPPAKPERKRKGKSS